LHTAGAQHAAPENLGNIHAKEVTKLDGFIRHRYRAFVLLEQSDRSRCTKDFAL
jgi:hypothetical protein